MIETDEDFRQRVLARTTDENEFTIKCIHVADTKTLDKFGERYGLYRQKDKAVEKRDQRFFVWHDAIKGSGSAMIQPCRAAIVAKEWLPANVLFKVELEKNDKRTIDELMEIYPCPT